MNTLDYFIDNQENILKSLSLDLQLYSIITTTDKNIFLESIEFNIKRLKSINCDRNKNEIDEFKTKNYKYIENLPIEIQKKY